MSQFMLGLLCQYVFSINNSRKKIEHPWLYTSNNKKGLKLRSISTTKAASESRILAELKRHNFKLT